MYFFYWRIFHERYNKQNLKSFPEGGVLVNYKRISDWSEIQLSLATRIG
jgi:hypothetical protein